MKTSQCLLCGETAKLQTKKFPGYQEPEMFSIYNCTACNTSFSLPRVDTTAVYNLIYSKAATVPGYCRYWKYKENVKTHLNPLQFLSDAEEMYWATISSVESIIKNKTNAKILEVGCGMGYLTYSLKQAGYDITGLDISQEAVIEANNSFGNNYICADIYEYAKTQKNVYDVIIMAEVIEHIEAPIEFLKSTTELLKPGGAVIVTTPNKTIFPNNIVWRTDLPPVHCWWLSENSMEYIANKINCKVDFVDFSDYYLKKNKPVNINLTEQMVPTHVFKKDGEIIINKRVSFWDKMIYLFTNSSLIINGKYSFINKFTYLTITSKIYKRFIIAISSKKTYHCMEKGPFICAVYKKL